MPEYMGEIPVRNATDYYTYTFKGWKPEIAAVTEAADYVAEYDSAAVTYTVRFLDYDGTPLQEGDLAYGDMPEYTGETLTRAATDSYTYTFKGWKPEIAAVTEAADYVAEYDSTAITYAVRFLDYDGTPLQEGDLSYGDMPEYTGEIPTREATDSYSYTFKGWDKEIEAVTAATDYTAVYDSTANVVTYTIRFINYDGEILQESQVPVGQVPVYEGELPKRPDDEQYTYTFMGWSDMPVAVTGEATYEAVYQAKPKTATDVDTVTITDDAPAYNTLGQPVGQDYRGVIIRKGKKIIR